jgi:HPt (histidine-containing phosphotransfer) domain-containing protein
MNDYVSKPVSLHALAEVLEKWLPKQTGVQTREPESKSRKAKEDNQPIWDRVSMIERLMGDEELAETILQGFLADIPLQIGALREYLKAKDAAGAAHHAHTIKGAAANVGAETLRAVAFEIEKAARAGDLETVNTLSNELDSAFKALKQAMQEGQGFS